MSSAPPPHLQILKRKRRRFFIVVITSCLAVLALLAVVVMPTIGYHRKKSSDAERVENMRQIALALLEFKSRYGSFPGPETVEAVRKSTSTDLDLGTTSSNDFFRQLLATGIVRSEAVFHSGTDGARRPDEVMGKGEALKKGECGFVYLVSADGAGNPGRPILLVGLIVGTDRFDRKAFPSKGVVANADGSVSSVFINSDGQMVMNGRSILDPANPVWGGKPPKIAWPE